MIKRRDFIKTGSAAALASLLVSKSNAAFFEANTQHAAGLQLFTFFGVIEADVPGTLKKIADIGYKEIESAFSMKGGFYGMKPTEFKKTVEDLGMSWKSHHVLGAPFKMPAGAKMPNGPDGKPMVIPPMRNLRDNMQELIDEVAEGNVEYLVCANIPTDNMEDLKQSLETLNKAGEACKKAGITFCYHNHDMEFKPVDGKLPYDMMLEQVSADNMKMEIDLCWVTKANVDPVELFKKYPGRFELWHVKDLDKQRLGPASVGEGVVDFKRIFDNASIAGMKHFFVEHDGPKDAYASITTSYNYLTNTLKV